MRPIIHPGPTPPVQTPVSNSTPVSSANTGNSNSSAPVRLPQPPAPFPQDLPFSISRSFMIDYMWHQHHQQQNQTQNSSSNPIQTPAKPNQFQFPPYSALSWIKQPPSSFLFKPSAPNPTGNDDKPAFNHFSAFKPVINIRVDPTTNAETSAPTSGNMNQSQSPSTSTSSYQSDDETLTPTKQQQDHRKKYQRFGSNQKEQSNYIDVEDDDSNQITINKQNNGRISDVDNNNEEINDRKEHMISDDENELVDIETTEEDNNLQIHDLQPYKSSNYYQNEEEEDIEVIDDKNLDIENNNNHIEDHDRSIKSRIMKMSNRQIVEIGSKGDSDQEEYQHKKPRKSPFNNNNEWTLNLKKEVSETFLQSIQFINDN